MWRSQLRSTAAANSQLILGVVWGHNEQSKLEQNMDGTEARRRSAQRSVQSQEYSPTHKSPKPRVQSQESARNAAYPNDTSTVSSRPRNCVTPGSACHAPGASTRASVTLASGGSRYTWSGYGGWGRGRGLRLGFAAGVGGWGCDWGLAERARAVHPRRSPRASGSPRRRRRGSGSKRRRWHQARCRGRGARRAVPRT